MREGVFVWQNTQLVPLEQLGCPYTTGGDRRADSQLMFSSRSRRCKKRAPENRSLFFLHRLTKDSYLLRVAL
jgi:hypothetical protein